MGRKLHLAIDANQKRVVKYKRIIQHGETLAKKAVENMGYMRQLYENQRDPFV